MLPPAWLDAPSNGFVSNYKRNTVALMKSAVLPPVRVEPDFREEVESVLREGETLSEFVESAVRQAAHRRRAQDEFVARGMASLAEAKRTGKFLPAAEVVEKLQAKLDEAKQAFKRRTSGAGER